MARKNKNQNKVAVESSAASTVEAPVQSSAASTVQPKLSLLGAVAVVLEKSGTSMSCKQLIEACRESGLWVSPNGKTPQLTLSAALQREIKVKAEKSRFTKTAPGRFALNK